MIGSKLLCCRIAKWSGQVLVAMLFVENSNLARKTGDPAVTSPLLPFWEWNYFFTSRIENHVNRQVIFSSSPLMAVTEFLRATDTSLLRNLNFSGFHLCYANCKLHTQHCGLLVAQRNADHWYGTITRIVISITVTWKQNSASYNCTIVNSDFHLILCWLSFAFFLY